MRQYSDHLIHQKYRPDIDGLRAIAILSVVCFHAFPEWVKGGFIGVDIFFVISGYLISTIIIVRLESNSFSFVEFYMRRVNRIFPALVLVLFATFILGWFAMLADEYKQLGKHIAGGAGFISNFLFWNESGYFDNAAETKPLLHLWSLAIEEQFYVFWPLLLWCAWLWRFNLLAIIITVAAISFALNATNVHADAVATFYSPQTRFWELMAGSALAYMTLHGVQIVPKFKHFRNAWLGRKIYAQLPASNAKTSCDVQSIFGAALIVFGILVVTKESLFPGWWALLPTLGTSLIISAGAQAWLNRFVLSNRVLVWFGLISFPLYLWHWPLLSFARIVEGEMPSHKMRIVAVLSAIALAWLTYRLIEIPIRSGRKSKETSIALLVVLCAVGYVGYNAYSRNGLEFRNKATSLQHLQVQQLDWGRYGANPACTSRYPSSQFCNITDIDKPPTALIIGDSHSDHFFWGLSEYHKKINGNLLNMGAGGCLPFYEIGGSAHPTQDFNCYSRMHDMYDYALHSDQIKTVYLSFHHSAYFQEFVKFSDYLNKIKSQNNYINVMEALLRTIQVLNSHGKNVVIIYDLPDLRFDIKACIRPLSFSGNPCKSDAVFVDDFGQYDLMLSEVETKSSLSIFHTRQFIDGNFPVDKNGILSYRDNTHLSINGSLFFVDKYNF